MKNFVKKILMSNIPGFILGAIVFGGIGIVVAENIASSTVDYNKNSQATVEDALDDLYSKASASGIIPYSGPNLALHIQSLYSYDGDGSNLYYHDRTGNNASYTSAEYEAGDLSYRYSGPTARLTSKASTYNNIDNTSSSANGLIMYYCSGYSSYSYVGYDIQCYSDSFTKYYYLAYNTSIHYDTYYEAFNKAVEEGYIESVVDNYVCFATDEEICSSENLYRIIGIFKDSSNNYQLKLIKATFGKAVVKNATMLGTNGAYNSNTKRYKWNGSYSNVWGSTALNTINLNTNYVNYLNNINSKWINMIDPHIWIVGGNKRSNLIYTAGANKVFNYEIENPAENTTHSNEIGLLYISDYMYGANSEHWTKMGTDQNSTNGSTDYRSATKNNWLYLGQGEWLITRMSDGTNGAVSINSAGSLGDESVSNPNYIRPVFYLKSNVIYYDGTGTSGDPYRIALSE